MIEFITQTFSNPFIALIGAQQIGAGFYSLYIGDWRIFVINAGVGVANIVLATMKG